MEVKRTKKQSRLNAVTHGVFAGLLLREGFLGESESAYSHILAALRGAVKPADSLEHLLLEKLAILYLRLTRVYAADWQTAPKLFEAVEEVFTGNPPRAVTEWTEMSYAQVTRHSPAPDLLMRYETSIERQIGRTLGQLEQWRKIRKADAGSTEKVRTTESSQNDGKGLRHEAID